MFMDIFQAIEDENIELIDLLIASKSNINIKSSWGDTPLIYAVLGNSYEIAKKLIDAGAKLDTRNADGITALRCAVEMSYPTMVDLLIDSGVNINTKDRKGGTTLAEAILRRNIKIIKKIIHSIPDINDKNVGINSAVQMSIRMRSLEVTKVLIQKGASLNEDNILDAIDSDLPEMVRFVIESGIDIDRVRFSDGKTSLMYAIKRGNIEICQMLIEAGADLSLSDNEGKTALGYAKQYKNTAIESLITSRN
jgi:ankyrin repeat protein